MSFDPLFALLVIVVLALPYLIWLIRADTLGAAALARDRRAGAHAALHWGELLGGLLLAMSGIVLLVDPQFRLVRRASRRRRRSSIRPPVDPLARNFVYFFAIAPALAGSLVAGLFGSRSRRRRRGHRAVDVGSGVIVATGDLIHLRRQRVLRIGLGRCRRGAGAGGDRDDVVLPWTGSAEVATSLPARAIARFFGDSFERRTNQPAAGGRRRSAARGA